MHPPLSGEVALVSGGSRGIGAAIALHLAAAGADVALTYRSSAEKAKRVSEGCRAYGVRSSAYRSDVRSRSDVRGMLDEVTRELGRPSLLIHNAGVAGNSLFFQDVTGEEYDRVMDTHVRGAYHLIQEVLPDMVSRRFGRIILLSSIWGESGGAGEVLYSAAKGAINAMARSLAKETAPSGITVNAVAPGAIRTDMLNEQLSDAEKEELAGRIPSGRLGEPEDVAAMIGWLCRREAGYVTGQVIHVNGGWYP
ncbi:3-oxoacyl-[acyl-carrier protein] reductase [Melghirimyces profundicolus]|uniref:3-oxoacyl-[acyl-carrier protein] reductase n=1 Tax=Melghirimyces profundicolus TaxID=1242148 RepID=A0A2T6BRD5_9BACL|nr:SDR family NAD(P)-dependent oxidoreductase [Melghirimyces profundicolus]PTX58650.1 3-oxoacyl-[acyl-carrier protein] reductase [Melghirimyces profundicolus]